ncbi:MAG: hypothetical protein JXR37_33905 [Kiritimatiellae bacterium]|nr:hypothetical protein [Kiritimatiellia bacterium]
MQYDELAGLFERGKRRYRLIGDDRAGVLAGLDLEGRLFAILDREVLNRVNPAAFLGESTQEAYLNPGGDGLWPAPEGTCLGYEYASGPWRVPPAITGARYRVQDTSPNHATIRAEIDLINNSGLGIPTAFERRISVAGKPNAVAVTVEERIEYLGTQTLSVRVRGYGDVSEGDGSRGRSPSNARMQVIRPRMEGERPREPRHGHTSRHMNAGALNGEQCLLAPWTLAQFDSGPGCEVVFPAVEPAAIRDLYDPSDSQRRVEGDLWHTKTDAGPRYQIALGAGVEWIEYRDPRRSLRAHRTAENLPPGQAYVDIADAPPDQPPTGQGVRLSVYSDPSGFMEIEAAGGCPDVLAPGAVLSVVVTTLYARE